LIADLSYLIGESQFDQGFRDGHRRGMSVFDAPPAGLAPDRPGPGLYGAASGGNDASVRGREGKNSLKSLERFRAPTTVDPVRLRVSSDARGNPKVLQMDVPRCQILYGGRTD
jgi:hypothetical protein